MYEIKIQIKLENASFLRRSCLKRCLFLTAFSINGNSSILFRCVRVWKGIFGIRDLTKIRCGNRKNDKYIDGIRDLTVPREARLAKNWVRDAGFMFACLSGMAKIVATHRFSRPKRINQASAKWCLLSNQTPYGVSR